MIAHDATSYTKANTAQINLSHTVGAGAKRLLVVAVAALDSNDTGRVVTGVTYGGVALTKVNHSDTGSGTSERAELWYLVNPTSGTANVQVQFTSAVQGFVTASSFTGVNQSSPLNTSVTGNGSSNAVSSTVVPSQNCLIYDSVAAEPTLTVNGAQTQASNQQEASYQNAGASYKQASSSTSMQWSLSYGARWRQVVGAFNEDTGALTATATAKAAITGANGANAQAKARLFPATSQSGGLANLQYRSVDTMDLTKDRLTGQPTDAYITNLLDCIVNTFNITHVSISIPLDESAAYTSEGVTVPSPRTASAYYQKWATEIHGRGKKIIHRGTFNGIEGLYGFQQKVGGNRYYQGVASDIIPTTVTDNFDRGAIGAAYQTAHQTGNDWSIVSGALAAPAPDGWRRTILTTDSYSNFTATAKIKKLGSQQIVVRATTDANFPGYGFQLRDGEFRLERPGLAQIATTPKTFTEGATYNVKVNCSGTTVRARVWLVGDVEPGTWDISVTDSTFTSGFIGFSGESTGGVFDDLTITVEQNLNSWLGKIYTFITSHPTYFANGDLWAILPERTEGIFSDSTSFLPYSTPGVQANYRNFFRDLKTVSDYAFAQIGVSVTTGMTANNFSELNSGWLPQEVFTDAGIIAYDYYGSDRTPTEMETNTRAVYAAKGSSLKMFHQEWGDYWNTTLSDTDRETYLRSMYAAFSRLAADGILVGFNYWRATTTNGDYSTVDSLEGILKNYGDATTPNFKPTYKAYVLAEYFNGPPVTVATLTARARIKGDNTASFTAKARIGMLGKTTLTARASIIAGTTPETPLPPDYNPNPTLLGSDFANYFPGVREGIVKITADRVKGSVSNPSVPSTETIADGTAAYKTIAPQNSGIIADLYTDGLNDQAELVTAVASLPITGGKIALTEGAFYVNNITEIIKDGVLIQGRGIGATTIYATTNAFDVFKCGNRQSDGISRPAIRIEDLTIVFPSGTPAKSGVVFDGAAKGSGLKNVKVVNGLYGSTLIDSRDVVLFDVDFSDCTNSLYIAQGLGNNSGNIHLFNPTFNPKSVGILTGALASQPQPNRIDRVAIFGGRMNTQTTFSNTVGIKAVVGITTLTLNGTAFKNFTDHINLQGKTQLSLIGTGFDHDNVATNILKLETNNHDISVQSVTVKNSTNGFNNVSGTSNIVFQGESVNNGGVTTMVTGAFAVKLGTDVGFVGSGVLDIGMNAARYNNIYGNEITLSYLNSAPAPNGTAIQIYMKADGKLHYMDKNGVEFDLQTGQVSNAPTTPSQPSTPTPTGGGGTPPSQPSADPAVFTPGATILSADGTSDSAFNADSPKTVGSENVIVTGGQYKWTLSATSSEVGYNKDLSTQLCRNLKFDYTLDSAATLNGEQTIFHAWTNGYTDNLIQIRIVPNGSGYSFALRHAGTDNFASRLKKHTTLCAKGTKYTVELYVVDGGFALDVSTGGVLQGCMYWYNGLSLTGSYYAFNNTNLTIDGISIGKFYSNQLSGIQYMDNILFRREYVAPTGPTTDAGKLADAWNGYKRYFIRPDGAVVRPWSEGVPLFGNPASDVVSEGQAYALMFAVQMNDQTTFDLVESWTYTHIDRRANGISDGNDLMSWWWDDQGDQSQIAQRVRDTNWATDADIDRIPALIWAGYRWGNGGTINYHARANAIIADMKSRSFVTYDGKNYMCADSFGQVQNPSEMNPSYWSIGAFKIIQNFTGDAFWGAAITGAVDLANRSSVATLQNRTNGDSKYGQNETGVGLVPDWVGLSTSNVVQQPPNNREVANKYDGFRLVHRFYWMKLWFPSDTTADSYMTGAIKTFYKNQWNTNGIIYAEYRHDGSVLGAYEKSMMTAGAYFVMKYNNQEPTVATNIFNTKLANLYVKQPFGSFYADNGNLTGGFQGAPSYFNFSWMMFAELIFNNAWINYT